MARPMWHWPTVLLIIFVAVSPAAAEPKRVLLLHSFGPQFAPWAFFTEHFREELSKQSPDKIDLYEISLEAARFDADEQRPFVDYLTALFGTRKLDLIVTVGSPATLFVQKYRPEFFPSTPLIIGAPEQRVLNYGALTSNDAPIAVTLDLQKWVENIIQVFPGTTHIAWVVGASPLEKFWTEEIRRATQQFTDRISFEWFNDLRFEEMLNRVSKLPPHSAVFFVDLRVDAAGIPMNRDQVLRKLTKASNAPVFSYIDENLGSGIVGGPMLSTEEVGRRMAEAAVRIMRGELAGGLKIAPVALGKPQYDWRELLRWNISENQLPAGSIVRFRGPTLWTQYSWQIALTCVVILLQAGLISGLLYQRRRRLYAEVQSLQRAAELAHFNRFFLAGELTATIAHEINQPLGAILANIETAELLVKSPTPDLQELREILADVRRDDERAGEVIRRLRTLLKKAPLELKYIDLNDVVGETLRLLSALAIAREVDLISFVAPTPLFVKGDSIQIEQVLLNLIINAMDAMSGMPSAERKVRISTGRDGEFADLSVSDVGPGIPVEKLKEVFEPFFSTKARGMGLGLSIARTIVEAHGGQIWAESHAGHGATFRIRLPLAGLLK